MEARGNFPRVTVLRYSTSILFSLILDVQSRKFQTSLRCDVYEAQFEPVANLPVTTPRRSGLVLKKKAGSFYNQTRAIPSKYHAVPETAARCAHSGHDFLKSWPPKYVDYFCISIFGC
jgi:hypothetical protein